MEMTRRHTPRSKAAIARHPLFSKRREQRRRRQATQRAAPPVEVPDTSKTLGVVSQDTTKGCVRFQCTSIVGVPTAFRTTSVRLNSTKGSDSQHRIYRSNFTIEVDHMGNDMEFRVMSPALETGLGKNPGVRNFVNNYMFDLYAHIITYMRMYLRFEGVAVEDVPLDLQLLNKGTGIDLKLADGLAWCSPHDSLRQALPMQEAKRLCKWLKISTEVPGNDPSCSSNSSSDSDSDSDDGNHGLELETYGI